MRVEYWSFIIFNAIFGAILRYADQITGTFDIGAGFGFLSAIYALFIIVPGIAVSVRRLHDTGRSGFWFLITIVPIFGLLVFIYFMVRDSQSGINNYGPSPKG